MERRGGQISKSSGRGRGAWANPLQEMSQLARGLIITSPPSLPGEGRGIGGTARGAEGLPGKVAITFCSSDESDSGGEMGDPGLDVDKLESSIMGDYSSSHDMHDTGLAKIRALLLARCSGATACLICLEKVRATDPVWDCKMGCHAVFHLICIQAWARQALGVTAQRSLGQLSGQHFPVAVAEAAESACWHCPKCRAEYSKSELPREYCCFCRKQVEPKNDPWLAPHTCGHRCGRSLPGDCGHECTLLCHPGPCPTCPQFLEFRCFCGADSEVRRCGHRKFSCGKCCGQLLGCGEHTCESPCHEGACPQCTKTAFHQCRCGRISQIRGCAEADLRCAEPCGKQLSCQRHWCDKGCHSGPCGDCALIGKRSCPCGKVERKGIACDVAVSTCGSTCEKVLRCNIHCCQERCHFGPCNDTCRVVLTKSCRCGGLKKEVPCHLELQCERKCQQMRECGRHACKRRCCDGDCPPCSEMCGRRLKCGNHRCPAPCHRGLCAPCPVTVQIACACGETVIQVPCGTEREQRPPRCSKHCLIPPLCLHGGICKPHRCHYGACPACQFICGAKLPCGHNCQEKCHGPRPTPNPDYTLKSKKKKIVHDSNSQSTGVPCPPCSECIMRQCLGQHPGSERMMVCSQSSVFPCEKLCGNLLACGNHTCQRLCHCVTVPRYSSETQVQEGQANGPPQGNSPGPTKSARGSLGSSTAHENGSIREKPVGEGLSLTARTTIAQSVDTCEKCSLQCQKRRADWCTHPCRQACHQGECSPCKTLVKCACYCGALVHTFECTSYNAQSDEIRAKILSCGGPCHRKLPSCTHLCPDICHPGPCPTARKCHKKVTVRCACQRLRKEKLCSEVQVAPHSGRGMAKSLPRGGLGLLPCDQECLHLAADRKAKEEIEQLNQRKYKEPEAKGMVMKTSKRCRPHDFTDDKGKDWRFWISMSRAGSWLLRLSLVLCVILLIFYGYRGLLTLSYWMNARDAAKPRRRLPGSYGP